MDQEKPFDAVVLGAGISGLVSAAILLDRGATSVLVVDGYPAIGGNHLDRAIGDYTFDVGSLIFQDDSPLLRWFPELLTSYVSIEPSWARLNPQGMVTTYPFSIRDDLLRAGPVELTRIFGSLLAGRLRAAPMTNSQEFAEYWLGRRLVWRSGLGQYMERFCGTAAHRIDIEFARSRMGWIAEYARIRTYARRLIARPRSLGRAPERLNKQLARPRSGFAELYAPVQRRLEEEGVRFLLGGLPEAVRRDGDEFVVVVNGTEHRSRRVISTIPIDTALRLVGLDAEPLPTVTLITLFYSFDGSRGFDASILYNFSARSPWKRLTVYSDFYARGADGREFFAVEVVHDGRESLSPAAAAAEFREHTESNELFRGDLRLEGHHVLEHAYPIYTSGSSQRAEANVAALAELGLESFGRQGGFQYQPTARVSTLVAEQALKD